MNTKTRKALLESIEHWHQNLDMLILNYLSGARDLTEDIGIYGPSCPLCEFLDCLDCLKCPVRIKTGLTGCNGTPWRDVHDWYNKKGQHWSSDRETNFKLGYEIIGDELEFLYSLLEE